MNLKNIRKNWEGFAQTDPMWSIITAKEFSKNKWNKEDFFKLGESDIALWFNHFRELETINSQNALDFGCGIGRLSQALCSRFNSVTGVDISEKMISLANEYNKYGIKCRYVVNHRPDLSLFRNDSFDFICSHITLQHLPPTYAYCYIEEFLRIIKPGGIILFSLPAKPPFFYRLASALVPDNLKNALRKLIFKTNYAMEMHWIGKEKMIRFLEDKGATTTLYPDKSAGENWEGFFYIVGYNKSPS